jgi:hypothetical protein
MKRFMKYTLLTLLLTTTLLFSGSAFAGTKNLHATWDQTIPPDFWGWKLFQDDVHVLDIPYTGQTVYETDYVLTSPDNSTVTYQFHLKAYDLSYNASDPSNTVDVTIDFEGPEAPFQLNITIEAQ